MRRAVAAAALLLALPAAGAGPGARALEHTGRWESGYGETFYNVVGRLENTSGHALAWVKLRVEALDAKGKVVATTETYNESAEALTVPDLDAAARAALRQKVPPLPAGAQERFRASFLKDETPVFTDYRVVVAETPAAPEVQTRESQAAMTPALALERLREGNQRFAANAPRQRDWSAKVVATAAGQFPYAAVLGCMDSRAPVEILFDQGIGDVFGLRVAGNVVNDDELGSLEYAVKVGTRLIVVLGHTSCGAVKGAIDDVRLDHLTGLLAKIRPAVAAARCTDAHDDACVARVTELNVRQSMREIRERSAYLRQHLDAGTVGLVGGLYDVATGRVRFLED